LVALFFKSDKNRIEGKLFSIMVVLFTYQLFATTIHPWYVIPILFIGVILKSKAALLWSFLIFFSYFNYKTTGTEESILFLFIEYVLVISVLFYDVYNIKKPLITRSF
jgi:alpha-1,6-mannosyltransferase